MLHRVREGWSKNDRPPPFAGAIEVDETFWGGKRKNMSKQEQEELTGRGAVGKTAGVGAKDRNSNAVPATVVTSIDKETLHGFVTERTGPEGTVYTDGATALRGAAESA